jgi:hypothetical protein
VSAHLVVMMRSGRALVILVVGVATWFFAVTMISGVALRGASPAVIQFRRKGTQPDRGENADNQEP